MNVKYLFIPLILFVTGCASTYKHRELQPVEAKLDKMKGVIISLPKAGRYGDIHYQNSGIMTAGAIKAAFSKHASKVDLVNNCNAEICLNSIDTEIYGYYVMPKILHWEERATEWSGKSDRIEVQIVIYDAITKKELANSSYTGKSKWATFGGDHPQDLLPDPTNEYVNGLYH